MTPEAEPPSWCSRGWLGSRIRDAEGKGKDVAVPEDLNRPDQLEVELVERPRSGRGGQWMDDSGGAAAAGWVDDRNSGLAGKAGLLACRVVLREPGGLQ